MVGRGRGRRGARTRAGGGGRNRPRRRLSPSVTIIHMIYTGASHNGSASHLLQAPRAQHNSQATPDLKRRLESAPDAGHGSLCDFSGPNINGRVGPNRRRVPSILSRSRCP